MSETQDCTVTLRRVDGPEATELFILCQPPSGAGDVGGQSEAVYSAIAGVLEAEGGGFGSVVSETVLLRNLRLNVEPVRRARQRVLTQRASVFHQPAATVIEQPPLGDRVGLEVMVHAVLPHDPPLDMETIEVEPACGCIECARAHGVRVGIGDEVRFHAGGVCGAGGSAYEQTREMFDVAERLLRKAGMEFSDVVRTWIYFRDIDRDYTELNRARRAFFEARVISPVPASTGIGGAPVSDAHDICLGLYAVKSAQPLARSVMTSPTLNEAPQYGADFVRGMRVVEANKTALYVSGTASIDEEGRTAHVGDFDAQAERMLVNIRTLLEGQGAGFGDVVSAITYLRDPANAARLRQKLCDAGFGGFPNAMVEAPICRADLLCEIEALAVLPNRTPDRRAKRSR